MDFLPRFRKKAWGTVHNFVGDRRGNVLITFAFSSVMLLGFMGLSTDSALGFLVNARMSKALDAAGLAAGRSALSADVTQEARDFFDANFPDSFLGANVTQFQVTPDANNEFITLSASATMPTKFMRLFGINQVSVSARTVIHRQTRGMELVLVMDNTGSMRSGSPSKMETMKAAAQNLLNILYAGNETLPNFWVSLVPFTATVNIGTANSAWLADTDRYFDSPDPFDPTNWKGCVEARAAPLDQTDTPPTVDKFTSFFWAPASDNEWPPVDEAQEAGNDGTGPNLNCASAITPLTAEYSTLTAAVSEMNFWRRGGTAANLGLAWGWRAISPQWRGLWNVSNPDPDLQLPLDYDHPLIDKVAVVLTDGQNQFAGSSPGGSDYTAYGRLNDFGFTSKNDARAELDTRLTATCEAMKANGIILYTITFGSTPNTSTQTLFRNCATVPANYFHAPTNAQLATAFQAIAEQLSNLRIAE